MAILGIYVRFPGGTFFSCSCWFRNLVNQPVQAGSFNPLGKYQITGWKMDRLEGRYISYWFNGDIPASYVSLEGRVSHGPPGWKNIRHQLDFPSPNSNHRCPPKVMTKATATTETFCTGSTQTAWKTVWLFGKLVGGFNPSEKYLSNFMISPGRG